MKKPPAVLLKAGHTYHFGQTFRSSPFEDDIVLDGKTPVARLVFDTLSEDGMTATFRLAPLLDGASGPEEDGEENA